MAVVGVPLLFPQDPLIRGGGGGGGGGGGFSDGGCWSEFKQGNSTARNTLPSLSFLFSLPPPSDSVVK
jgi:hypothetical protein